VAQRARDPLIRTDVDFLTHPPPLRPTSARSGRLRPAGGEFEARGAVTAYLAAGAPAAVANLWDVSDRDIDRFADSLLRRAVLPVVPPPPPAALTTGGGAGAGGGAGGGKAAGGGGGGTAAAAAVYVPPGPEAGGMVVEAVAAAREDVRLRWAGGGGGRGGRGDRGMGQGA
jgi:hypothetical protein